MITKEEYLKAKAIVEEYEDQEYTDGMNNAMYCVECQALHEQECICDDKNKACHYCGLEGTHTTNCIYWEDY